MWKRDDTKGRIKSQTLMPWNCCFLLWVCQLSQKYLIIFGNARTNSNGCQVFSTDKWSYPASRLSFATAYSQRTPKYASRNRRQQKNRNINKRRHRSLNERKKLATEKWNWKKKKSIIPMMGASALKNAPHTQTATQEKKHGKIERLITINKREFSSWN